MTDTKHTSIMRNELSANEYKKYFTFGQRVAYSGKYPDTKTKIPGSCISRVIHISTVNNNILCMLVHSYAMALGTLRMHHWGNVYGWASRVPTVHELVWSLVGYPEGDSIKYDNALAAFVFGVHNTKRKLIVTEYFR